MFADLARMIARMGPEAANYALCFVALLLVDVTDVGAPVFLALAVDTAEAQIRGTPLADPPWLSAFGLNARDFGLAGSIAAYLVFQLIANVFRYPMVMYSALPSQRIAVGLRRQLVEHLLRLPQSFYDRAKSGDIMSVATSDINAVRMFYGPGVLVAVDTFMVVATALALMLSMSWQATLIVLLPMPIVALVTNALSHAEYKRFEAVQDDLGRLTERVRESYSGIRILQGYARERFDRLRFFAAGRRHYEKNLALTRVNALFDPTLDLMLGASSVLVLLYGGARIADGSMTTGTFVGFLFLIGYLSGPMIGFGWSIMLFQRGRASMKRIETLLDEAPVTDAAEGAGAGAWAPEAPGVEIRDLTFAYAPRAGDAPAPRPALRDVSVRIRPGGALGLTGPVGGGKSTLAALLTRLYEPPSGTVFVDGRDVRTIPLDDLRRVVVLAPQDTFLFSDTLARNLGLSDPERAHDPLPLLRTAHLYDDIAALPDGVHTLIGERGVNLSGGQRQRLAVARAVGADPRVLVLDDCLSAVDAETEDAVLHALEAARAGRTSIAVSHRVRALRHCDEILVLDGGRVVERGTHAQLLAAGGWYAAVAAEQGEAHEAAA